MTLRAFELLLVALAVACASPQGPGQLTGSVTVRERSALPEAAVVRVTLLDVSLIDLPARVLAELEIRPTTELPVLFTLAYDRAAIDPARLYALRGTISAADGRLLWTTASAMRVLTRGAPDKAQLVLERVRAAAPAGPRLLAYACDRFEFRVEVTTQRALLFLPGRSLTLAALPAASGAKYSDGNTTFWSKGDTAQLTLEGAEHTGCRVRSRPLP